MTKTLQYLTVTTLAAGLAAGIAWGAKGGGKPGGGGGGDTSTPVIADFAGGGRLTSDRPEIGEDPTYSNSTVPGGRVELPATGNFTMDLKGTGRVLNIAFSNYLGDDDPPPTLPSEAEVFMSINRHCLEPDLNGDGSCSEFAATEGSLKALQVEGPALLLGVHMQFAHDRNSYWVKCGASGGDAPDKFSEAGTDWVRATCEFDDENGCTAWHLTAPIGASGLPESLQCRVFEKTNKSLIEIGDYDLSFDLTLYRDQP